MIASIPPEHRATSATVDGMILTCKLDDVDTSGPASERFRTLFHHIDSSDILEQKHGATQLICAKTRGQFTVQEMEGQKPMLAKARVHHPKDCPDQNQYMIEEYRDRTCLSTTDVSHLTSTRDTVYLNTNNTIGSKPCC